MTTWPAIFYDTAAPILDRVLGERLARERTPAPGRRTPRAQAHDQSYAVLVCGELPVPGRNGYSTYLHAFFRHLEQRMPGSLVVVVGPQLPVMACAPAALMDSRTARFAALHAWRLGPLLVARTPAALIRTCAPLKALCRMARRFVNRRQRPVAGIGREMTAKESGQLAELIAALTAERGAPAVVLVDTIFRQAALDRLPASACKLLIAHDVFHQRCESLRNAGLEPIPWITRDEETARLGGYDGAIAISAADAESLRRLRPAMPIHTLPSPVQVRRPAARAPGATPRVLFIGSKAPHNVDGMRWFLDEVWPGVVMMCPGIRLDVVGGVCAHLAAHAGVTLHGRVDDPMTVAAGCHCAINPVRAGSGLNIKLLDYFACGLHCVTTAIGAEGLPREGDPPVTVVDHAAGFAAAVAVASRRRDDHGEHAARVRAYAGRFSHAAFDAEMDRVFAAHGIAPGAPTTPSAPKKARWFTEPIPLPRAAQEPAQEPAAAAMAGDWHGRGRYWPG